MISRSMISGIVTMLDSAMAKAKETGGRPSHNKIHTSKSRQQLSFSREGFRLTRDAELSRNPIAT